MAMAVPLFYIPVINGIMLTLTLVTFVVEIVAFVHCLVQRSDGFAAIDTFPKSLWLLLIGGSAFFAALDVFAPMGMFSGIFMLITITIALVYLLDVRPAIRDTTDGHGPW